MLIHNVTPLPLEVCLIWVLNIRGVVILQVHGTIFEPFFGAGFYYITNNLEH